MPSVVFMSAAEDSLGTFLQCQRSYNLAPCNSRAILQPVLGKWTPQTAWYLLDQIEKGGMGLTYSWLLAAV